MKPDLPPIKREDLEAKVTALLLGELPEGEAALMRELIARDPGLARFRDQLSLTLELLRETAATAEPAPAAPRRLSEARREKLLASFKTVKPKEFEAPRRKFSWLTAVAAVAVLVMLAALIIPNFVRARTTSMRGSVVDNLRLLDAAKQQWALEKGKPASAAPTMEDLRPYVGRGEHGEVPGGKGQTYELGIVGQPPIARVKDKAGKETIITLAGTEGNLPVADTPVATSTASPQIAGQEAVMQQQMMMMRRKPSVRSVAGIPGGTPIFLPRSNVEEKPSSMDSGSPVAAVQTANKPAEVAFAPPPPANFDFFNGTVASAPTPPALQAAGEPAAIPAPAKADRDRAGTDVQLRELDELAKKQTPGLPPEEQRKSEYSVNAVGYINVGTLPGFTITNVAAAPVQQQQVQTSLPEQQVQAPLSQEVQAPVQQESLAFNYGIHAPRLKNDQIGAQGGTAPAYENPANVPVPHVSFGNGVTATTTPVSHHVAGIPADNEALPVGGAVPQKKEDGGFVPTVQAVAGGTISSPLVPPADNALPQREVLAETLNGPVVPGAAPPPAATPLASAVPDVAAGTETTREKPPAGAIGTTTFSVDQEGRMATVIGDSNALLAVSNALSRLETKKDSRSLARYGEAPSGGGAGGRTEGLGGINVLQKPAERTPVLGGQPQVGRLFASKTLDDKSDAGLAQPALPPIIFTPEVETRANSFSTFSLNVSDASYKLAAAGLQNSVMPQPASIRSEEFINAFDYRDPDPAAGAPIAFNWDRAQYPFAHNRDLLRFAVKTPAQGRESGRPLNLVLLLDKSGSMERADRVAIIHEALRALASELRANDTLSVIVFARTARLWLDGVPGSQAAAAADNLDGITPEGGTNLEDAMKLAYETALRHYLANGENRVVLVTDGAANLGNVDPEALKQKVEGNRKQGISLDCFGVGWDGYNDNLMEALSRAGNGRYGFINTPEEAATEFAGKLAGALRVAASDVKVQVEFNPNRVTAWRQVGYDKHQLTKEQFRDNTVVAAQIGAAESGNALYVVEVNPAGDGPVCTVRVRFHAPGSDDVQEHAWEVPYTGAAIPLDKASPATRLAAVSGAFAEWLASSPFAGEVTPDQLLGYLRGVPELYGADGRAKNLEWMIRQAKSITGK